MKQVPIAEGLVASLSTSPRLIASHCLRCDARSFPVQSGCIRCGSEDLELVELPPRGRLWTWTSQNFLPKSPPYAGPETSVNFLGWFVGYVDLDGLLVEGRLVGFDERTPEIGEELELVAVPFKIDDDGDQVMIYAFEAAGTIGKD